MSIKKDSEKQMSGRLISGNHYIKLHERMIRKKKRKEKELTLDILGDSTRDTSLVSPFCDMRLQ